MSEKNDGNLDYDFQHIKTYILEAKKSGLLCFQPEVPIPLGNQTALKAYA